MSTISYHSPGQVPALTRGGDILLTHSTFWTGRLIRFGQFLRWRGERRTFGYWNHTALCIGNETLVEALGHGVQVSGIEKYNDTEYAVIHTYTGASDREQVIVFANSVLRARAKYGFLEILSLGLTLALPLPVQFGSPGTAICSGFVAEALTRNGSVWGTTPEYMMPADIAEHYNATAPSAGKRDA